MANLSKEIPQAVRHSRNATFDVLRIVFASLVVLSHSFELPQTGYQPFFSPLHIPLTFGMVAVDGFFLLSGYLIVRSWLGAPHLSAFLQKRVLRIVPGYFVAVFFSVLVVGLFAPATPHFFSQLFTRHFAASVLTLNPPVTPRVFPGYSFQSVNGSLWTISQEFRCYLLVALFGATGLLRRRWIWLACTLVSVAFAVHLPLQAHLHWTRYYLVFGEPSRLPEILLPFLVGGCFALYRVKFRPSIAAAAAVALLYSVLSIFARQQTHYLVRAGWVLCGGYLLFYLARLNLRIFRFENRMPDVSYGTYLYGWPVQCFCISLLGTVPWVTFAISLPVALLCGWLSWELVERPAMQWKRQSTAPLKPA